MIQQAKFLFICSVFVFFWSSGWIGSKYALNYAGTFTLLVYRYLLVFFLLLAFVIATRSWRAVSRHDFVMHCFVGVLAHGLYLGSANSALELGASAGLVSFVMTLQPMMTATLSCRASVEKASYQQWLGLALGFVAIVIVISDKIVLGASVLAYTLPFIAIFSLSFACVIDRQIKLGTIEKNQRALPLSFISLIHITSALVVFVPIAGIKEGYTTQWSYDLIFSVVWLALLVTLGAYGLMFLMLQKISAIKVASLTYLSPPTTMLIAYFVLGDVLTVIDSIGLIVAAVAVWLVFSGNIIKKPRSRELSLSFNQRATTKNELLKSPEPVVSTHSDNLVRYRSRRCKVYAPHHHRRWNRNE